MDKWTIRYLQLAHFVKSFSRDPSTKVGCAAMGHTPNLTAIGWNDLPPGIFDDTRLQDREWKLDHVIHAEMNTLANARFPVHKLFVTQPPCHRCAVHILAHRSIDEIFATYNEVFMERWGESVEKTKAIFEEAGIAYTFVKEELVLCRKE